MSPSDAFLCRGVEKQLCNFSIKCFDKFLWVVNSLTRALNATSWLTIAQYPMTNSFSVFAELHLLNILLRNECNKNESKVVMMYCIVFSFTLPDLLD